jgi:hypothetical protein
MFQLFSQSALSIAVADREKSPGAQPMRREKASSSSRKAYRRAAPASSSVR